MRASHTCRGNSPKNVGGSGWERSKLRFWVSAEPGATAIAIGSSIKAITIRAVTSKRQRKSASRSDRVNPNRKLHLIGDPSELPINLSLTKREIMTLNYLNLIVEPPLASFASPANGKPSVFKSKLFSISHHCLCH